MRGTEFYNLSGFALGTTFERRGNSAAQDDTEDSRGRS
jgi:hypothetical protein